MSDLDRLLQQVEELKRLATRPDDSWMDALSNEELQALGKPVRKVADGLSGLQGKLNGPAPSGPRRQAPAAPPRAGTGSLGGLVKGKSRPGPGGSQWTPPGSARPAAGALPAKSSGMDLASPMRRRVGAAPSPPSEPPRAAPVASQSPGNLFSPFSKPQGPPSSGKRSRPQL